MILPFWNDIQFYFRSFFLSAGHRRGLDLLLVFSFLAAPVSAGPIPEYQIKAGYIYRFLSFVEWPAAPAEDSNSPFIIGILGKNPFDDYFKPVEGTFLNGREIIIKKLSNEAGVSEMKACRVLFIAASEETDISRIVHSLAGYPVLTVGEIDGFIDQGGIINFVDQDNKIKFEINDAAAEQNGLKIRSIMKRLATRIIGGEP